MKVGILILWMLFQFSLFDAYAQYANLLSDRKMTVDFNWLVRMNEKRYDDSRFVSGSLNIIPMVYIYPRGEWDWESEVFNYESESRVLLYNTQMEFRLWSIRKPGEDPNREWIEKNGFYSGRYLLYETHIEDKLRAMISFIGSDKQLYFVYFFPSEANTTLPVIGYVENGKNVFVDSYLRKYDMWSLLDSRYGSVERYRELYDNYTKLMSYDPGGIPEGSYTRLISHTNVVKEIAECVEDYKIKNISGCNIRDSIVFRRSEKNTLVVTFYAGKLV